MSFADVMDFSREGNFQERLLERINAECFSELTDDDLDLVNAAGTQDVKKIISVILPDLQ